MTSSEISYQLGTIRDVCRVADLSRALIEKGLGWSWTPMRLARNLQRANTVLMVARCYKDVVGFSLTHYHARQANLNLLAVDLAYQGRGIGRELVLKLEASARLAGIDLASLEVRAGNLGARTFYSKMGYRETGLIRGYYQGKETAVRMEHHLGAPDPDAMAQWHDAIENLLARLGQSTAES